MNKAHKLFIVSCTALASFGIIYKACSTEPRSQFAKTMGMLQETKNALVLVTQKDDTLVIDSRKETLAQHEANAKVATDFAELIDEIVVTYNGSDYYGWGTNGGRTLTSKEEFDAVVRPFDAKKDKIIGMKQIP